MGRYVELLEQVLEESKKSKYSGKFKGTFKVNKGDWSGEKGSITVKANGTFTTSDGVSGKAVFTDNTEGSVMKVTLTGDHKSVGSGHDYIGYGIDGSWMVISGDINRSNKNPFVALFQVISNTI